MSTQLQILYCLPKNIENDETDPSGDAQEDHAAEVEQKWNIIIDRSDKCIEEMTAMKQALLQNQVTMKI